MTATLDLMNALVVHSGSPFTLSYGQETSGQAGGQIRVRDLRRPLWTWDATCETLTLAQLATIEAEVGALGGSRGTFYAWDPARAYPAADPDGSILGASSVTIHAMADATHIRFAGLPAGYVLTKGDLFSFEYGSGPRKALHRMAETVTANGSGQTDSALIAPPIRAGATTGVAVTLVRAPVEMAIVPGSYDPSVSGLIGSVSFSAIQVV